MAAANQYLVKTIYLTHGDSENLTYHFLYGYSIPSPLNNYDNQTSEPIPLLGKSDHFNLSLSIEEKFLTKEELNQLHQYLEEGNNTNPIAKKDPQVSFDSRPAIYQFGHTTLMEEYHFQDTNLPPESISPFLSTVKSFIQLNKVERLLALLWRFSNCDQEVNKLLYSMLSELKNLTGLNFCQNSAGRLFNFESFEFPLGNIFKKPDIRITVKKEEFADKSFSGKAIMIEKKGELLDTKHIAHIRLLNNNEVILQKIVHLAENLSTINADEDISAIEVSIFTENGSKLLYTEKVGLLREIHLGMHLVSGSVVIEDKFSSRVNDPELKTIDRHSTDSPSRIGGHKNDPWVPESQTVKSFVRNRTSKPKDSFWFPKGIESEGKSVKFLRELIDHSNNEKVIIVDPFFGKAAISRLLFRLQNSAIDFEILTSFSNIDPDSTNSKSNEEIIDELKVFCSDYRLLIPSGVSISNLRRGCSGNQQAFHDRYLCLKKKGGNILVYLLSNSLNAAAAKYPFCISKLDICASREIYYYIRSLAKGIDPSDSNVKLARDEVLDPKANSVKETESEEDNNWIFYFSYLKQFLSWLFNDAKSNRDSLIEKAIGAGYVSKTAYGVSWENKSEELAEKIIVDLKNRPPSDDAEWAGLVSGIARLIDGSHINENLKKQIDQLLLEHLKVNSGLLSKVLDRIYIEECEKKRFREARYQRNTMVIVSLFKQSKEQNSYQVFDSLKNLFEYYSCHETPNCYELQYLFKLGFKIAPQLIFDWFSANEDKSAETIPPFESFLYVQLFNYAFRQLAELNELNELNDSVNLFLNSPCPALKMLGAAFLTSWKGGPHNDDFLFSVNEIVEFLEDSNFEKESILWILCTRIPDLRIEINRKQTRPELESAFEELEQNLENYLTYIADKWPLDALSKEAFMNASKSFHFRSQDAYAIAKSVEKTNGAKCCPSSRQLFDYCENVINKWLHSNKKHSEPHFYGPKDYDDIITAAKAFVELRKENAQDLPKAFRNKFGANISSAVQSLSVPFAQSRNYEQWNNDLLISGIGCYFMLQVLVASHENDLYKDTSSKPYVQMTLVLLELSSKMFLSEQGSWHEMYGLMDKLACELAWFSNIVFPDETASFMETVLENEYLPLDKRAVFALKTESFYRTDNKTPGKFLARLLNEDCSEHADSKFFHCLDFCIGNTGKYCLENLPEIKKIADIGLEKYPKIPGKWREFFGALSFEAFENEDAKTRILTVPEFASSYCGYVLERSDK